MTKLAQQAGGGHHIPGRGAEQREEVDLSDYRSAILELCRVACEVRTFPLLALDGRTSPYVASIVSDLSKSWEVSLETVPYEVQRGGTR